MRETQGFVRLVTPNHLDTAVPLQSANTALQIALQLHRPRRQSTTWMQPLQHRRPEPLCVRKHRVFHPNPHARTSPERSSSSAICNHCLANYTTTALTKAAIHHMNAAITMRSARLNRTLQWRTRPSETEQSHRQGSQHRRREPLCARKHRGSSES